MRHRRRVKHFKRDTNGRQALIRGLVTNLVEHGRIRTTLTKAKELRRHVEKAVTMGKKGSVHARRLLLSRYPNQDVVETIMSDLAVRFKERPGGYTRILKLNRRAGDNAPEAFIEFVDFDAKAKAEKKVTVKVLGADRKLVSKEMTLAEREEWRSEQVAKAEQAKKKKKILQQKADRRRNRK